MEAYNYFAALAEDVDRVAPRPASAQGGRPPYPTQTVVRILVLERLYNLSDEEMVYPLLERMSYQRLCGLASAVNIPDCTTVWIFGNRIGETGAQVLCDGISARLLKHGVIARGGQIVDATRVPAPRQRNSREKSQLVHEWATPLAWKWAKPRQKDVDATWTRKHDKQRVGYKQPINVDAKYKVRRQFETGTASIHDTQHFEAVIGRDNTICDVYADRGRASADRERSLTRHG